MALKLWLRWIHGTVESLFLPHHHICCLCFSPKQNKTWAKMDSHSCSSYTWLQIREGIAHVFYWAKGGPIAGKGIFKEGLCSVGPGTISFITMAAYSCTVPKTAHLGEILHAGRDHSWPPFTSTLHWFCLDIHTFLLSLNHWSSLLHPSYEPLNSLFWCMLSPNKLLLSPHWFGDFPSRCPSPNSKCQHPAAKRTSLSPQAVQTPQVEHNPLLACLRLFTVGCSGWCNVIHLVSVRVKTQTWFSLIRIITHPSMPWKYFCLYVTLCVSFPVIL